MNEESSAFVKKCISELSGYDLNIVKLEVDDVLKSKIYHAEKEYVYSLKSMTGSQKLQNYSSLHPYSFAGKKLRKNMIKDLKFFIHQDQYKKTHPNIECVEDFFGYWGVLYKYLDNQTIIQLQIVAYQLLEKKIFCDNNLNEIGKKLCDFHTYFSYHLNEINSVLSFIDAYAERLVLKIITENNPSKDEILDILENVDWKMELTRGALESYHHRLNITQEIAKK
jgi:hypothetical protein